MAKSKPSNPKQTSPREAKQAGRDLQNPKTPRQDRGPIASDLAQSPRKPAPTATKPATPGKSKPASPKKK